MCQILVYEDFFVIAASRSWLLHWVENVPPLSGYKFINSIPCFALFRLSKPIWWLDVLFSNVWNAQQFDYLFLHVFPITYVYVYDAQGRMLGHKWSIQHHFWMGGDRLIFFSCFRKIPVKLRSTLWCDAVSGYSRVIQPFLPFVNRKIS